mmetsp:Transcript_51589/g.145412  ORF Transcript_51589/g.145412 Transcript_51589/m.145412 type:complete len:384 (-) Transcript_51589:253-1404(-)
MARPRVADGSDRVADEEEHILGTVRRELAALHQEWRASRDTLEALRAVVQGEQERSSAIEARAAAEHARVGELGEGLRTLKTKSDETVRNVHLLGKGLLGAERRVEEAHGRANGHDSGAATAASRLSQLEDAVARAEQRLGMLDNGAGALRAALGASDAAAMREAAKLSNLQDEVATLRRLLGETDERARDLHDAHRETSGSLHHARELMISPALQRAEQERCRLDEALSRVEALELSGAETAAECSQLHATSDQTLADLEDFHHQFNGVAASTRFLLDGLASANMDAKADHESLEAARLAINGLREDAAAANSSLTRLRMDVSEVRADCGQRDVQVSNLASSVTALEAGVKATDGEVCDLRELLEIPRSDTPTLPNSIGRYY